MSEPAPPRLTIAGEVRAARSRQRLLPLIIAAGRPIGRSCRGRGICGACRVEVRGAVEAPSERERAVLERCAASPGERLACLTVLTGDAEVNSPTWTAHVEAPARGP